MQMAKRMRLLAEADQSKKASEITAKKERTSLSYADEAFTHAKKLCKTIAKLESERRTLLEEMRNLETKALRGWTQMSGRQIYSMVMLGVALTTLVILIPFFFIDPFVSERLLLSTLDHETELVSYLREIQAYQNVYLAVHGYDHKCPICGSTGHEVACASGQIPLEEIQRRIKSGLEIFNKSGLEVDWYAFPGQTYDERALSVFRNFSSTTYKYGKAELKGFLFDRPHCSLQVQRVHLDVA